jgi:cupin 2 domain-containing protein
VSGPLKTGDLFADVPARLDVEETAVLAELPSARIERIVSTGQASPPGFWYDQDWTEWSSF